MRYKDGTVRVRVSHAPNVDIRFGYWTMPNDSGKERWIVCKNLDEAIRVCQNYIGENELGGGNWTGGSVQQYINGQFVSKGRIAYNGRLFAN